MASRYAELCIFPSDGGDISPVFIAQDRCQVRVGLENTGTVCTINAAMNGDGISNNAICLTTVSAGTWLHWSADSQPAQVSRWDGMARFVDGRRCRVDGKPKLTGQRLITTYMYTDIQTQRCVVRICQYQSTVSLLKTPDISWTARSPCNLQCGYKLSTRPQFRVAKQFSPPPSEQ